MEVKGHNFSGVKPTFDTFWMMPKMRRYLRCTHIKAFMAEVQLEARCLLHFDTNLRQLHTYSCEAMATVSRNKECQIVDVCSPVSCDAPQSKAWAYPWSKNLLSRRKSIENNWHGNDAVCSCSCNWHTTNARNSNDQHDSKIMSYWADNGRP